MTQIVVADTFFDSARRLDSADRARVLDFLGKFHDDPRSPGLHLEKIQSNDPGMRSARITQGLRAILHTEGARFTLLFAGQHDDAYDWAQRRRLDLHPRTGALQIVETAEEIERAVRTEAEEHPAPKILPADRYDDDYLLSLGVPENWLPTLRLLQDEDQLLRTVDRLPAEVGERLVALAAGELVTPPAPIAQEAPLEASPDNLRRFWVVDESELARELEKPFEAWLHFLHPSQRQIATQAFNGPAKVTGSAGTGKSVVAMHRARNQAREGREVLLTSFVTTLCQNLERNLELLCNSEEREHIRVATVHAEALRLLREAYPNIQPVDDESFRSRLDAARKRVAPDLELDFLEAEWNGVVASQGAASWEEYRDVERRGRGKPLSVRERKRVWSVFASLIEDLGADERITFTGACRLALELLQQGRLQSPYDTVIVDEVQDLKPVELRFLAALASRNGEPPQLMLCGDAGQRIYPGGFSLRSLGIDVRGRSLTLHINYRTTDQIRRAADRILGETSDDLDGGAERRDGTRSLLRGPEPVLHGAADLDAEVAFIASQIEELLEEGVDADEIAVFARTGRGFERLEAQLEHRSIGSHRLARDRVPEGVVRLGTMHRAKGLEFRVVFVTGCRDGVVPLRSALARTVDPADRDEALARERSLLYVSLTRARDQAFVTWNGQPSPFLTPLLEGSAGVGREAG